MIRKGAYLLCGLLIIACSLYATEDDYDARKAEMVRRNGTKGNIIRLTNDYIGVAIDDTTGQFGVGISRTSLDTMLTYGYPDIVTTSHTIFNVDNLSTCDYTNMHIQRLLHISYPEHPTLSHLKNIPLRAIALM